MKRRTFQITDSTFKVERHADGWRVIEFWWEAGKRGEDVDMTESHGPYPTKDEALAEMARMEGP